MASSSPHAVVVRRAFVADVKVAAELFAQYREFQGQASDPEAEVAFLQARLERRESVVFIAFSADHPVGLAQLFPSFSSVSLARVFVLNDLFVAAAGRRQGVASELLAAVESYAWSEGAARVTLNVANDNGPGQALYEARGWLRDRQFLMYHRFPEPAGEA